MQAMKIIRQVKNGKASIDHIPKEFGTEVEIIVLPVKNDKKTKTGKQKKSLLDLAGKATLSSTILAELEQGRHEDRF